MSQPPAPHPILNYFPADPHRPRFGRPFWTQMLLGLAAAFAALLTSVLVAIAVARTDSAFDMIALAPAPLLLLLSGYLWVRWRWPGFLAGALLVIGLVALPLGLCAAGLTNVR